ncbi:MAG: tyrosine-type recombinase/integrase [Actinomycetota bacterium]
MGASTRNMAWRCLRSLLNVAKAEGLVTRNVASGNPLAPRKLHPREGRNLTPEQIKKLAASTADGYEVGIWLMGVMALRASEMLALRVEDVYLDQRRIHVRGTKSEASDSMVPMTSHITKLVSEQYDEHSRNGWLIPSPEGRQYSYNNWYHRVFIKAVEKAEIGEVVPHDLRHSAL